MMKILIEYDYEPMDYLLSKF